MAGTQKKIALGNMDAKRDWGFAGDYVEGMWRMLQADKPDDFVLATGDPHSVKEFLELAFRRAGLEWSNYVEIDERHLRPAEVDLLHGDAAKARATFGWTPKVGFTELVEMMVDADIALARREALAAG